MVAIARIETWHFLSRYVVGAILGRIRLLPWLSAAWSDLQVRRLGRLIGMNDTSKLGYPFKDEPRFEKVYEEAEASRGFSQLSQTSPPTSSLSPRQLFRLSHAYFSSGDFAAGTECIDLAMSQLRTTFSDKPSESVALLGNGWSNALGHCLNVARFLLGCDLGILPYERVVLLTPSHPQPNRYLLQRLRKTVSRFTLVETHCAGAMRSHFQGLDIHPGRIPDCHGNFYDAHAMWDAVAWESHKAEIDFKGLLSHRVHETAERLLMRMGIHDTDRVIAIHVRSGSRGAGRGLANADIRTYVPALKHLTKQGYRVVRLGDPTMPKVEEVSGLIDYAHQPIRSPWLDIYLWWRAYFAIGTCSGGSEGFSLFGTPTVFTNTTGIARYPFAPRSFVVPKLFQPANRRTPVSLVDTVRSPWGWSDATEHDRWFGTSVIDNRPEDIINAVIEMEQFVSSGLTYLPLSTVQRSLLEARKTVGRPERSMISESFVATHTYLSS